MTPDHIIEAAYEAAKAGQTKYPPTAGTPALRQAVADKFRRENQLTYNSDQIIVSNGAKQVIFNALMASMEPGQEVVLPAPYFGSYKDAVLIQGGVPVSVPCTAENSFQLTPNALEAAITQNTRWVFLNLPSNPAGAMCDSGHLCELGAVLTRHPHVLILSDEIYEHVLFDDRAFTSLAAACPDLNDRILTVNGVSKAYAMTGWRIGFGAGPAELIKAMVSVQSQICSGACSVAQAAALAALTGPQDCVAEFCDAYRRRRDLVVGAVKTIPGLTLDSPAGAFYAYIGCSELIGRKTPDGTVLTDDVDVTRYLLEYGNVAAVPGDDFGLSPFFRLSTANLEEMLQAAMQQIAACLAPVMQINSSTE